MKNKDDSGFSLSSTFVHLSISGKASKLEVGPDFFQSFKSREDLQSGRLMGASDISEGRPIGKCILMAMNFCIYYPALWMLS